MFNFTENDLKFGFEVASFAETQIGREAVLHRALASCGFKATVQDCMEIGLGPVSFDCSGLAVAALSSALGSSVEMWPDDLRHVRQMHRFQFPVEDLTQVSQGDLVIFGRNHIIDGEKKMHPGHIGIVNQLNNEGFTLIHAVAKLGVVVEQQLPFDDSQRFGTILGVVDPSDITI